jgi:hypothetical protein
MYSPLSSNILLDENNIVNTIFNIFSTIAGGVGSVAWEVSSFWVKVAYEGVINPVKEKRIWQQKLKEAQSYKEWSIAAKELDR